MKLDKSLVGIKFHLIDLLHRSMGPNEHSEDKLVPILLKDLVKVGDLCDAIHVVSGYLLGPVHRENVFGQLQAVNTVRGVKLGILYVK